jgi:hypothetical protein
MNKRTLHHLWVRLRPIKTWYLLAICLMLGTISVIALRDNYTTMRVLRSQVYAADEQNADVVGSLNRLRRYVNNHMNTSLTADSTVYPPIQLMHTYQRLQKAEQDRVNAATGQVYTDAQHYCEQLYPGSFSGGPRVPCIEQYVKEHVVKPNPIPEAIYKFNFASPRWSPDLAGVTLALSAAFGAVTILRFVVGRVLESLSE